MKQKREWLKTKADLLEMLVNDEKPDGLEELEEARKEGLRRMDEVVTWFEGLNDAACKKYQVLRQSFDQARVQLSQGEMGAGDTFEERMTAFVSATRSARSKLEYFESEIDAEGQGLWDQVVKSWKEIESCLEVAYVGVMFSEELWENEERKKERFHGAVVALQSELEKPDVDGARELDKFLTKSDDLLGKCCKRALKLLHRFFEPK